MDTKRWRDGGGVKHNQQSVVVLSARGKWGSGREGEPVFDCSLCKFYSYFIKRPEGSRSGGGGDGSGGEGGVDGGGGDAILDIFSLINNTRLCALCFEFQKFLAGCFGQNYC